MSTIIDVKRKSDVHQELSGDYKNQFAIPQLKQIVVSGGFNRNQKKEVLFDKIQSVTNQLPVYRKTRKSIAAYKIRAGMETGVKVNLRRAIMEDFLHKLIYVVLPAVTAWRGLKESSIVQTSSTGSISMGVKDMDIFPSAKSADRTLIGCNITIVVKSSSVKDTVKLLKAYGFPFEEDN